MIGMHEAISARELCEQEVFTSLGIVNTSVVLATQSCIVLTDDFRLWGYLNKIGVDASNFHHLETML